MENKNSCFPENPPNCPITPLANYTLDARVVANYAPADGASLNGVHYTLSSPVNLPVANQRLDFSVNGSPDLIIPTYYTNNSGVLDVGLTNETPESVQLSASLAADPTINAISDLSFTPVYPVFLGSVQVTVPAGAYSFGLQEMLRPFNIIAGHRYRIEDIPSANFGFGFCPENFVHDQTSQTCNSAFPNDYDHLSTTSITPVRALRSGLGGDLHSRGYYYNLTTPYAQIFTVQVYDDGPD
ncbi:hypothetical protein [Sodalis sp. dw_96]|uniref:Ig-like domain-containing protein n=1 Tax=Sodalis sp. dw_96 TaxID=2719794 RepID=UPI001BD47375|nr:hypothetical protein [Sodalis sp. dw_96]